MSDSTAVPAGRKALVVYGAPAVWFEHPIAETVMFDDVVVVRLEPPPKARYNENVFGVDYTGTVRWQIAPVRHVYDDSPYVRIARDGLNVRAYNWDGLELVLERASGRVLEQRVGR